MYIILRMNTFPCSVCKEAGHHPRECPELCEPLKPGFHKPSGGGGGHSHDDDDEKLKLEAFLIKGQWRILAFPSHLKKRSV